MTACRLLLVFSAGGSTAALAGGRREHALVDNLAPLADAHFQGIATGQNAASLRATLTAKGVISASGRVRSDVLRSLARTDPLKVYRGHVYSATELELYSLAYLLCKPAGATA